MNKSIEDIAGAGAGHENPEEYQTLQRLEAIVAKITGQSVDELRNQSLSELRRKIEKRVNRKMSFGSRFPLIGRGSVMRDRIVDHQKVEALLDQSLK